VVKENTEENKNCRTDETYRKNRSEPDDDEKNLAIKISSEISFIFRYYTG
jgi:hypothetical protein